MTPKQQRKQQRKEAEDQFRTWLSNRGNALQVIELRFQSLIFLEDITNKQNELGLNLTYDRLYVLYEEAKQEMRDRVTKRWIDAGFIVDGPDFKSLKLNN